MSSNVIHLPAQFSEGLRCLFHDSTSKELIKSHLQKNRLDRCALHDWLLTKDSHDWLKQQKAPAHYLIRRIFKHADEDDQKKLVEIALLFQELTSPETLGTKLYNNPKMMRAFLNQNPSAFQTLVCSEFQKIKLPKSSTWFADVDMRALYDTHPDLAMWMLTGYTKARVEDYLQSLATEGLGSLIDIQKRCPILLMDLLEYCGSDGSPFFKFIIDCKNPENKLYDLFQEVEVRKAFLSQALQRGAWGPDLLTYALEKSPCFITALFNEIVSYPELRELLFNLQDAKDNFQNILHVAFEKKCLTFIDLLSEPIYQDLFLDLLEDMDEADAYPLERASDEMILYLNETAPQLLEKALFFKDDSGSTCFHKAAVRGKMEELLRRYAFRSDWIKKGLHERDNNGNTPLLVASESAIIPILQADFSCIEEVDNLGRNILHLICQNDVDARFEAFQSLTIPIECYKILLSKQDSSGRTPLHYAAMNAANREYWKQFVLLTLNHSYFTKLEFLNLFSIVNHNNLTPLDELLGSGLSFTVFVPPQEGVDIETLRSRAEKLFRRLLLNPKKGGSPSIFFAAKNAANLEKCIVLIGADDDTIKDTTIRRLEGLRDSEGNSLMHAAALYGNEETYDVLKRNLLFHLIKSKANLLGITPLHFAAHTGNVSFFEAFSTVDQMTLAGLMDHAHLKPIHYALQLNKTSLFKKLLSLETGDDWLQVYHKDKTFPIEFDPDQPEVSLSLIRALRKDSPRFDDLVPYLAKDLHMLKSFLRCASTAQWSFDDLLSIASLLDQEVLRKALYEVYPEGQHPMLLARFDPKKLDYLIGRNEKCLFFMVLSGQIESLRPFFQKKQSEDIDFLPVAVIFRRYEVLDDLQKRIGRLEPWETYISYLRGQPLFKGHTKALEFSLLLGDIPLIRQVVKEMGKDKFFKTLKKGLEYLPKDGSLMKGVESKIEQILYDVDLTHLQESAAKTVILPEASEINLIELLAEFSEINFHNPQAPGYCSSDSLQDDRWDSFDTMQLDPTSVRRGLARLIRYTHRNKAFLGTYQKRDPLLEVSYNKLAGMLRTIVYKLRVMRKQLPPETYMKERNQVLVRLGLAGPHCFGRWMGDSFQLALKLLGRGEEASYQGATLRILEELRENFAQLKASQMSVRSRAPDVSHSHNGIVSRFGEILGIRGAQLMSDPLAPKLKKSPLERIFQKYYNAPALLDRLELEAFSNAEYRNQMIDFTRQHVPKKWGADPARVETYKKIMESIKKSDVWKRATEEISNKFYSKRRRLSLDFDGAFTKEFQKMLAQHEISIEGKNLESLYSAKLGNTGFLKRIIYERIKSDYLEESYRPDEGGHYRFSRDAIVNNLMQLGIIRDAIE